MAGAGTPSPGAPGPATVLREPAVLQTQRVRQWEARQLQSIEEATQHELVVEDP